ARSIIPKYPAVQFSGCPLLAADYNIRVPGPGMVTVIVGRAGAMVWVRVIVAYDLQPARSSVLLHPNLICGINQKAVSLRFGRRRIDRQNRLSAVGLMPQVPEGHHLRNFLEPIA